MAQDNGKISTGKRIMRPLTMGRSKHAALRLAEMNALVIQAQAFADDGNWPECYADDVTFLLQMVDRLQKALPRTTAPQG